MDFHFRDRSLVFGGFPVIMAILNATPDSFSDGGSPVPPEKRMEQALAEGAQILDIGGESTRPGAAEISVEEELHRVIPAIQMAKSRYPDCIVSVDTRKSVVAREALESGADIVNDVSGLSFDPRMAETAAAFRAGMVLMHSRSLPETMMNPEYTCYRDGVIAEVRRELLLSAEKAAGAGIPRENIILDPGIGFAKTAEQSAMLIRFGKELLSAGYPLLSGPSRKSFIGKITGEKEPSLRDYGTCGSVIASMLAGYSVIRVHNVKAAADAMKVFSACCPDISIS